MIAKLKEDFIDKYCHEKNYSLKKSKKQGHIRIDVSNIKEHINITLYDTGSLVIGGSPTLQLRNEFEDLKKQIDDSPEILEGFEKQKVKSVGSKYNILLEDVRNKIKNTFNEITSTVEIIDSPTPSEEYRAKLSEGKYTLSITQYKNGTLFLQGKDDILYDKTCDFIEKIATPSDHEVIVRFIANNDEAIESFSTRYTPKLTEQAELIIKNRLSDIYSFLNSHDKKWLVASESLRIINIPLPEYSPIVMPASKAFEGFIKKLLLEIGFYPPNHFNSKSASFSYLNDRSHSERKKLEAIESHAGTYLDKIGVCLDTSRNFMMHSDGSVITKIEKYDDASKKLDEIYDDLLDIYRYFKNSGFIS